MAVIRSVTAILPPLPAATRAGGVVAAGRLPAATVPPALAFVGTRGFAAGVSPPAATVPLSPAFAGARGVVAAGRPSPAAVHPAPTASGRTYVTCSPVILTATPAAAMRMAAPGGIPTLSLVCLYVSSWEASAPPFGLVVSTVVVTMWPCGIIAVAASLVVG